MINKLFTEKYDEDFKEIGKEENNSEEIGEYNRYPQMMPWIGREYGNGNHKKILLIGESHYLPENAYEELATPGGWYYQEEIDSESYSWTNTREVVECGPNKWTKAHSLYREVNNVMANIKSENSHEVNMFQFIAFYNYFLRPAYPKGASFKNVCEPIDENVAFDAFCNVIQIIKPDFVYFFSRFAWNTLHKKEFSFESVEIDFSPHPASPWWNKKNYNLKGHFELMTGREKFANFLKDNHVF